MDLSEWAHHYLIRNSKLKGWTISGDGPIYTVEAKKSQRYLVTEALADASDADVIITLNTRENIAWSAEHLESLGDTRIVFANPTQDSFWTLNARMIRMFGDSERYRKKPEAFSTEVALV